MLSRHRDPTFTRVRKSSLGAQRLSRLGGGLSAFATLGVIACLVTINFSRAEPGQESKKASPPPAKDTTAAGLYQRLCQGCHGDAGKGQRGAPAENVPDFTASSFHAKRSDPQLLVSILDGKGNGMPAFRGKLTEAQARTLTAYVRSFDPERTKMRSTGEKTQADFDVQFRQLQKEFEELRGQLDKLRADKPSPEKWPKAKSAKTETGNGRPDGLSNAAGLYRRHCERCHRSDGKGDGTGLEKSGTPDFTCRAWQQQRSDDHLKSRILDGKENMPAFRKTLSEEEAELLVEFIRSFKPPKAAPVRTSMPEGS